jgi:hypothetical protein
MRKEYAVKCAGCHQAGQGAEIRSPDDSPLELGWVILPPGWMLRSKHDDDDWQEDVVCSEACMRKVNSRRSGAQVAEAMAKPRAAWAIVTEARTHRHLIDLCEHCHREMSDERFSGDDGAFCSEACRACKGRCPHGRKHWLCDGLCNHAHNLIAHLNAEHATLCDEVDRLRRENAALRGDLVVPEQDRELETAAAEIIALDERATKAPWGEKCGMLKHYVFSKDPAEDFGASLQEMHYEDGHPVPAHDNASLIAFYRNYAPGLARSWSLLWRRSLSAVETLHRLHARLGVMAESTRGVGMRQSIEAVRGALDKVAQELQARG